MFTGIVEDLAEVASLVPEGDIMKLALRPRRGRGDLEIGGSLAVNGCCLTATAFEGDLVHFDLARETVVRTRFDTRLRPGSAVNLERPLRMSARLDGHFVQGHVDGVAVLESLRDSGQSAEMTFSVPETLARYCIEKGSIALDGVSLTCAAVSGARVTVAVIPHTLKVTNLGLMRVRDLVNVEVDMIAKYVERLLAK